MDNSADKRNVSFEKRYMGGPVVEDYKPSPETIII